MREATQRQLEVRNVIRTLIDQRGYPPTIREIADYLGIQVSTVFRHLAALEKKGYLEIGKSKARALTVVK